MSILVAAVISTLHLEGAVDDTNGDYVLLPLDVPVGTVEIAVTHDDGSDRVILDWGVWSPEGFRGWGGGNTEDIVIGVDESSRSYLRGAITTGEWTLVIGKAKLSGGAGMYTVDVEFRDAATLAPVPHADYDAVTLSTERRWYAGDLHVHSEESGDATATLAEIATLAQDRGLDFVVVTDHNTISHHERLAAAQPDYADLLFVRGIEVTTYAGHGNAIGVADYVDHRVGLDGVSATTIIDDVVAQGAVFSVNHPALELGDTCIGCAWTHAETPWDEVAAIEIHTGAYDVSSVLFTPLAIELWDGLLDDGHRISAVGGSDDHRAGADDAEIGSPTTMILADGLSEQALLDGIRAGRTVVKLRQPDDPMVVLTMSDADGGEAELGDTVTGVGEARLHAHVTDGDGTSLEIYRDGVKIDTVLVGGDDATIDRTYPVSGELERYRAEIVGGVGRLTVTSHVYVDGDPALADDGGCCSTGGDADLWPLVLLLPLWRRRKKEGP